MEFKILEYIVNQLEPVTDLVGNPLAVNFGYGTEPDLKRFLDHSDSNDTYKDNNGNSKATYPLIWVVTPTTPEEKRAYFNLEWTPTIIIATENTNYDMLNKDRNSLTFEKYIDPIFEDFKVKIHHHSLSKADRDSYRKIKRFNYQISEAVGEGNSTVWDALEFSVDLSFNSKNNCVLLTN